MADAGNDPYTARRGLTFAQAEGVEPLPQQLALKSVSRELKALVWAVFVDLIPYRSSSMGGGRYIGDENWEAILRNKWILRDHKAADEFNNRYDERMAELKSEVWSDDYIVVFGLLQWLLTRRVPNKFRMRLGHALEQGRAAYRLVDNDLIAPITGDEDGTTLQLALAETSKAGWAGSRSHLRAAAAAATGGRWAECVRESVHSVESAALTLSPGTKTLGPALAALKSRTDIHPALVSGFGNIYGFSSDESGIRHALLEKNDADVDETDALFMLGACAAFVSYLIGKGRSAGLLA